MLQTTWLEDPGRNRTVSCNSARHPAVDDPGLHRDPLIGQIKVEHRRTTGHRQKRLLIHQRSPERRCRFREHERHTVLMAALQHRSDLFGGLRQHRQGQTVALQRRSVTVVTKQFRRFPRWLRADVAQSCSTDQSWATSISI